MFEITFSDRRSYETGRDFINHDSKSGIIERDLSNLVLKVRFPDEKSLFEMVFCASNGEPITWEEKSCCSD